MQAYLSYCALLYCIPSVNKSVGSIFPTAFVHFMFLCHILVILTIFQTFSLLLYLL